MAHLNLVQDLVTEVQLKYHLEQTSGTTSFVSNFRLIWKVTEESRTKGWSGQLVSRFTVSIDLSSNDALVIVLSLILHNITPLVLIASPLPCF